MRSPSRVERLSTEGIGKLLWEMSSQTTFSLLVYAIYSLTDTYFLSVGVNSLAAAGASIVSLTMLRNYQERAFLPLVSSSKRIPRG